MSEINNKMFKVSIEKVAFMIKTLARKENLDISEIPSELARKFNLVLCAWGRDHVRLFAPDLSDDQCDYVLNLFAESADAESGYSLLFLAQIVEENYPEHYIGVDALLAE